MQKRGGGVPRLFVQFFCLTVPKKFVGEHFALSENFGYRKNLSIREEGYHLSPSKTFFTQYRKSSLGNTLVFQKNSFIEIFHAQEGWGASRFRQNFLSHRTETTSVVKEPFCFPENFWYRKNYGQLGAYHDFQWKLLCFTVPKDFVGIPSMFQKTWGIENFFCIIRGITFIRRTLLVSQCQKLRKVTVQCSTNFGYQKLMRINRKNNWRDRHSKPKPPA